MPSQAADPEIALKPRLAMIVEDNQAFAGVISDALGTLEGTWNVLHHADGSSAIAALSDTEFRADLVLVDIGLPDISGLEVIRAARQHYEDVPILVISVMTSAESVLEAIKHGARGYLHKGDSLLSLAQAITGVMDGQYPISPSLAHYLFQLAQFTPQALESPGELLSARELELLRLLGQGHTYEEAARRMAITLHTVQTYSKRIHLKLQVTRKSAALAEARKLGLI